MCSLRESGYDIVLVLSAATLLSVPVCLLSDDSEGAVDPSVEVQELTRLAEEYEQVRNRYWGAVRDAKTDEERTKATELNPDDEYIPKYLAFEVQHRGTEAGFSALRFVISNGARYGDPEAEASKGRVTACERLRAHYYQHPDVDSCLRSFESGIPFPDCELLLRKIAEQSPHRHVRAAAEFYLAKWLNYRSRIPEYRERARGRMENGDEDTRKWAKLWLGSMEAFGDVDADQMRAEAILKAHHVIDSYPEERPPSRIAKGPVNIFLSRDESLDRQDTFSELAERLLVEIQLLAIGANAPEITGTDADGGAFQLSDYLGRVVVLMFSANWCGPCKAMYPGNRRLLKDHADDPFVILGVMADHEIDTVQQAHTDGEITWRVWWDGDTGPITSQWNVRSWPTFYVIDHRGVIRHRQLIGDELREAVEQLLRARGEDPEADQLLARHPIPEIPTLTRAREAAAENDREADMP